MVKQFFKERLGTIILLVIVAIFVTVGFFSIKKAKNNAITYSEDYTAPEATANLLDEGEYKLVAQTSKLELYYNDVKGAIQVKNLENGHLWKGVADKEVYDIDDLNAQWAAYLQSPITISYNDLKKRDSGVTKLYAGRDCGFLETEYIPNGVAVTYGFLRPGIYVTLEYTLEDDNLVVRVPWEKVREEYKYAITTVEVMPYLGACKNDNDGYLFYPDGSGAITTYAKVGERPSNVKGASYYVYTNKSVSFNTLFSDAYDRYTASLPVYGIKDGDNAIFAFGTKGAENSGIIVYPSGYVVDLNHACFEVYLRNVFNVNMYNVSGSNGTATGGNVQRVDKNLIKEDKEIRYSFLCGDKADYGGMAASYRDYLLDNGLIKSSVTADTFPLTLRLLMGSQKDGLIFKEYVEMTRFKDVITINERLKEKGVTDIDNILVYWQKDYADYEYWGPDRHLGGKSGLKEVSEYAEKNSGINVFLENDFLVASDATKKFNEDDDVAYDGVNIEIAQESFQGKTFYLVNPLAAFKRNKAFVKKLKEYDGIGIGYWDIGRYAYADYNEIHPYTKSETVRQFTEILAEAENNGKKIASAGSNEYVFKYSDFLYMMKEGNFGLSITDYEVPFVQMVVSGLIPYSTEGAGNLSYNLDIQKLKWIEYGASPYFYLTYESALNLRDTDNAQLFSSTYADWEDTLIDTYKEFKENLSCVYGKQITDHTIISEDVRKIGYENGYVVYVNYGEKDASADGYTIPARGYIVTGGAK
ncbi:MAG: hypothetical protein J6Z46_06575 [Lachnospiraceae bacterium]|nr:hypothetical protein [Lachnospiraceae bacterium]